MPLLQNKKAIIYGASGSLGSAIAKAFAAAGATLFLTGRNIEAVQHLAYEINTQGGNAEAAQVDAMNENAVNAHAASVAKNAGTVDISFNLIGLEVVQNRPLVEMTMTDFTRPVNIAMQSHFLTAVAAGRIMIKQGSGVILSLTATPGGIGYPGTAGFAPACAAIESLYRNLAGELGPYGVRAVNIRSAGSPDSVVFKEAIEKSAEAMVPILRSMEADTMLKRLPLIVDITNTAVFLASGLASGITGVTVDVTCGTTAGLNYRASAV